MPQMFSSQSVSADRAAAGQQEPADFGAALVDHVPALRAYGRALTRDLGEADDLVQDCLLKAMEKQHLYKRGTNLRAWLLTVLRNLFINDYRRKQARGTPLSFDENFHDAKGPEPMSASRATRDQIEAALASLPAEQREVVVLIPMQGFSYEEVAEITKVPLGTVRSRLSRARTALKRILDRDASAGPGFEAPEAQRRAA